MGSTYKADALARKYEDFMQPAIKISMNGKELKPGGGLELKRAEITISCRKEPNIAVLAFVAARSQGKAVSALEGCLALGCKAEILLGYGESLSQVFLGYLHEIEVVAGTEEEAEYELTCLDVKGRMMADSLYETSGQKKEDQLLKELLKKSAYGPFIQKQHISGVESYMNRTCIVNGQSDYDWVSGLAEYLGYEFYLCGGDLYFRKSREDTSVMIELTRDYGAREIQTMTTLAGQYSDVEVVGYSRADKKLSGKAQRKNPGGPFESKLSSFLSGSGRAVLDGTAEEQTQAAYRAKTSMAVSVQKASGMKVFHIGLPELVPGRFVKVTDDIMASLCGTVYVQEVTHFYGADGYWSMLTGYR